MSILAWIILGLVAGFIASKIVNRHGEGIILDVLLGIVGSVVGGWLFHSMRWHAPFAGIAGTIFIAFIGAVLLLAVLRVFRSGGPRRV